MKKYASKRVMAHKIIYNGREYRLSIAEFDSNGNVKFIIPFKEEISGTIFINGTFTIESNSQSTKQ